jgi:hypothetical protein
MAIDAIMRVSCVELLYHNHILFVITIKMVTNEYETNKKCLYSSLMEVLIINFYREPIQEHHQSPKCTKEQVFAIQL